MNNVEKLKAKEFIFDINAKSGYFKIGFGKYFCGKNQKITISDESNLKKTHEIENLKIDNIKKTAEFYTYIEETNTHFVIKEVFSKTLDIMNFIKSYNENPFPIYFNDKDEISIMIDKDGFHILLEKANYEKRIYLSSSKIGPYLLIYHPKPAMRFAMKSCKVTEKGLCIEHDSVDLYNNMDTNKTIYNWDFNLQPEMLDLITRFINLALIQGK